MKKIQEKIRDIGVRNIQGVHNGSIHFLKRNNWENKGKQIISKENDFSRVKILGSSNQKETPSIDSK